MNGGEILYLGCYTSASGGGRGEGVMAAVRDPQTGRLKPQDVVAYTPSPSYLAWHPTLPVIYAANEVPDGTVSGWSVASDGLAAFQPHGVAETGGDSPCHLAVTPDGSYVLVANYGSGSVAVHPLARDGRVGRRSDLVAHDGHGPDRERQEGPHAHMISFDPGGGPLVVVDLGTDRIYPYRIYNGRLLAAGDPVHVTTGMGPRHIARHPDGRRIYVVGELDGMITGYEVNGQGWEQRHRVAASTRPGQHQPSEIAVRGDGRYLYVGNRGVDTVSVFALDGAAPRLVAEVDCGGHWPRDFAQIGGHLYVANERSHGIAVFAADKASGALSPVDVPVTVPSPTCVLRPQGYPPR